MAQRLAGVTVFMSASVPTPGRDSDFPRVPDAAQQIEQAVISLTRAVLSEGGRLVFGGHPAISPLVATVAGEYRAPRFAESAKERPRAQVRIYQSEIWREHAPESTMLMFHLGMADVEWIAKDPDERLGDHPVDGPGYPRSLGRMREEMLARESPDCMVAIGGMSGVIEEARLYRRMFPERRIYVFGRTGGASAALRDKLAGADLDYVDERILGEMHRPAEPEAGGKESGDGRRRTLERDTIPYPLIAQTIVAELAETHGPERRPPYAG